MNNRSSGKVVSSCGSDNGCFILGKINGKYVSMLVDTGSTVTLMRRDLVESWEEQPTIEPVNMTMLTATGETSPFYGKINIGILIGKQTFDQDVYLADIKNDVILGVDFLSHQNCEILLHKKFVKLNGEKIHCFVKEENASPTCSRVAIVKNCVIPPESEVILQGKPVDVISQTIGIVEPKINFCSKSGLLVAKALVDVRSGCIPLRVINFSNQPYTVYENTIAATYEGVTIPDTVSVQAIHAEERSIPFHLTDVYACAEKGLAYDEKLKVKELLSQHQNIFSKSSDDLGRTNLVEHAIDTGSCKPIEQAPYRTPPC